MKVTCKAYISRSHISIQKNSVPIRSAFRRYFTYCHSYRLCDHNRKFVMCRSLFNCFEGFYCNQVTNVLNSVSRELLAVELLLVFKQNVYSIIFVLFGRVVGRSDLLRYVVSDAAMLPCKT